MTRFKRATAVEQYGSKDLAEMTAEEIVAADGAGHLAELLAGRDPDAQIHHGYGCSKPPLDRVPIHGSIRSDDPIHYRCAECGATDQPQEV